MAHEQLIQPIKPSDNWKNERIWVEMSCGDCGYENEEHISYNEYLDAECPDCGSSDYEPDWKELRTNHNISYDTYTQEVWQLIVNKKHLDKAPNPLFQMELTKHEKKPFKLTGNYTTSL